MLGMQLKKNEVFGIIEGAVLRKRLLEKHILQKPHPAVCIDAELLRQAIANGVDTIIFELLEREKTYSICMDFFLSKRFALNRGWGQQFGIRIADLEKEQSGKQLPLFDTPTKWGWK